MATLILIPYRDRVDNFNAFLNETVPILTNAIKNVKILIIEQVPGKKFNRGKLLNAGFKEYADQGGYPNIITHDIDFVPDVETVKNFYLNDNFDIVRIYCGHNASLGGICKIKSDAFRDINGFPNNIWGWGIEDRALFWRSKIKGKQMSPNYLGKSNIKALSHPRKNEEYTGEKKALSDIWVPGIMKLPLSKQQNLIDNNGLNDLTYKIVDKITMQENVDLIKVDV